MLVSLLFGFKVLYKQQILKSSPHRIDDEVIERALNLVTVCKDLKNTVT